MKQNDAVLRKNSRASRFNRLAEYNRRANEELYAVAAFLTGKALKRDAGSWFGSILGILNHVIITDMNWLKRFRNIPFDSAALKDARLDTPDLSWEHPLHDDLLALAEERKAIDGIFGAWFKEFPESLYDDVFEYRDSHGASMKAIAADAFDFLFTHQIHHRGQISMLLDQIGLPNNFADNGRFLEEGIEFYRKFGDRAEL